MQAHESNEQTRGGRSMMTECTLVTLVDSVGIYVTVH